MLSKLFLYLQYPFVRYALIVGVLIALCSSLLGVILVLKRFSFIGDGLSHVAFGAMSFASVVNLSNKMYIVLPLTIASAVLLLKNSTKSKISGDAMIAMISVTALSFGYLLMNIVKPSSNISGDVCTTLFGSTSILTLRKEEVALSCVLSLVVLGLFVFFYNKILAITFDEDFARATGVNVDLYNTVLAVVIAVIIVLAMNLVGSLLISALVIFPSISGMRLFQNFKQVSIFAALSSVICTLIGIILSILYGTPVGSTIVAVDAVLFVVCALISRK